MGDERKSTLGDRWDDPVGLAREGEHRTAPTLADRHYIVGARPVKTVSVPGGGLDVQAFDWATGDFVRAMEYLTRVSFGDPEVDEVSAERFESEVRALRAELGRSD